jgi:two-component SAPR family response regulator
VQWRSDACFTLDVAEVERALAQAEAAERASDHSLLRRAFEQAVALYQGDLLPECYDDWVLLERERLRQTFHAALSSFIGRTHELAEVKRQLANTHCSPSPVQVAVVGPAWR